MLQAIALILATVVSVNCYQEAAVRTVNTQAQFKKWPYPNKVPYYIDKAYNEGERQAINSALVKFMIDLKGCVTLTPVEPTDAMFKVKITPFGDDGVSEEPFSFSYPGFYKDLQDLQGRKEQRLVLARGSTGCFDGNIRNIMKYFAVLFGKRNEHQRGDRDQFLQLNSAAWNPKPVNFSSNAYRLYSTAESYWDAFPYDYCSITHNKPSDFANPGQQSFRVLKPPYFIPQLNRLSNGDCQLISMMYNCKKDLCDKLDCALEVQGTTPAPKQTPPGTATTVASGGQGQPDVKSYVKFNFNDTVIILIDHQIRMMDTAPPTSTVPLATLKYNVVMLAKIAKKFNMSLILATALETNLEFYGTTIPELQQAAPVEYAQRIQRYGPINCWIVPEFVARVKSTGKKNLIMAGVASNIAVPPPAMDAVQDGYNVKVVIDAGASEHDYEEYVMWMRLQRYGVDIISLGAFVAELVKDASGPGGEAYSL